MQVTFDKYAYNPLYWHLKKYLADPKIRNVLFYGGSSAGKTHCAAQLLEETKLIEKKNVKVFRKENSTIKDSVYQDFKNIANKINEAYHFFDIFERWIKCSDNITSFGGMDDPEKAKGLSSYKYLFLNELSKFNYKDWKEVKRRMRGIPGQTLLADWNPISEEHWIKKKVIDNDIWNELPLEIENCIGLSKLDENSSVQINEKGNTILIKTTYLDNYWISGHPIEGYGFLDQNTIDDFEFSKENDPEDYNVYGLGNWGVVSGKIFREGQDWEKCNEMPPEYDYKFYGCDLGGNETNLIEAILDGEYLYLREIFSIADSSASVISEMLHEAGIENHYILFDHNERLTYNELKAHGHPVMLAEKGPDSVMYGIRKFKAYKKVRVLKTSKGLIKDFNNYSFMTDANGDSISIPDKKKYDPHKIDAARYAVSKFNV